MFTPNDDVLNSRKKISRRRALSLGGTVSLAGLLAACSPNGDDAAGVDAAASTGAQTSTTTSPDNVDQQLRELLDKAPGCVTSPEETQGPYYFDVDSIRRDITEGRPGLPLELMIRVQKAEGCVIGSSENPVENAAVEIWHCDAGGVYSGFEVSSQSANQGGAGGPNGNSGGTGGPGGEPPSGQPPAGDPPGGGPGQTSGGTVSDGSYAAGDQEASPTDDGTYLRGAQMTNSEGIVRFTSIYPGWYVSRTVHIHVKVHINRDTVLTTQLFFDDTLNDTINAEVSPYNEHTGRDTYKKTDTIYSDEGLMQAHYDGEKVIAAINIGI